MTIVIFNYCFFIYTSLVKFVCDRLFTDSSTTLHAPQLHMQVYTCSADVT